MVDVNDKQEIILRDGFPSEKVRLIRSGCKLTECQVENLTKDASNVREALWSRDDIKFTENQVNKVFSHGQWPVKLAVIRNKGIELTPSQIDTVLINPLSDIDLSAEMIKRLKKIDGKYQISQYWKTDTSDRLLLACMRRDDFNVMQSVLNTFLEHLSKDVRVAAKDVQARKDREKLKKIAGSVKSKVVGIAL